MDLSKLQIATIISELITILVIIWIFKKRKSNLRIAAEYNEKIKQVVLYNNSIVEKINAMISEDQQLKKIIDKYNLKSPKASKLENMDMVEYYNNDLFWWYKNIGMSVIFLATIFSGLILMKYIIDRECLLFVVLPNFFGVFLFGFQELPTGIFDISDMYNFNYHEVIVVNYNYAEFLGISDLTLPKFIQIKPTKPEEINEKHKKAS